MVRVRKYPTSIAIAALLLTIIGHKFDGQFTPVQSAMAQSTSPCAGPAANAIVAENCLPGSPSTEWDVGATGDLTIQGFATDISVTRASSPTLANTVHFKINVTNTNA